ncbi:hypothetical protein EVAR_102425_1 [Eumeta japonica]|uniref:Uncharacterized protein n=1 Tax=Eumeta variegata TaxID=151549 RepID=A0A4C1Z1M1_EUMVA|nr:hypothetical protein EVAR_102425_1 [Eumeta japonica]
MNGGRETDDGARPPASFLNDLSDYQSRAKNHVSAASATALKAARWGGAGARPMRGVDHRVVCVEQFEIFDSAESLYVPGAVHCYINRAFSAVSIFTENFLLNTNPGQEASAIWSTALASGGPFSGVETKKQNNQYLQTRELSKTNKRRLDDVSPAHAALDSQRVPAQAVRRSGLRRSRQTEHSTTSSKLKETCKGAASLGAELRVRFSKIPADLMKSARRRWRPPPAPAPPGRAGAGGGGGSRAGLYYFQMFI